MAKRARAKSLKSAEIAHTEKQTLGKQVVARILELIQTGSLRAGDRLPPERELIEIFGVGRSSLREALQALSTLGVIESRHGPVHTLADDPVHLGRDLGIRRLGVVGADQLGDIDEERTRRALTSERKKQASSP